MALRNAIKQAIPQRAQLMQQLRKSTKPLGELTVAGTLGGMRGYNALFWQSSQVDADKGVTFHGKTIKECQQLLPKCKDELADPHSEFLPESMFWFLLTGEIPTQEQANELTAEIASKGELPEYLVKVLDSLPSTLHPMTQLSIAISALNNDSTFARAYERGIAKSDYWEYTLEDSINLVAKLPGIIGKIYSNTYHKGKVLGELSESKDWSHNMATVLGFTQDSENINNLTASQSQDFTNLIRLYCALHADHEGGNVSAHATHLVGSALSDAYLSYSSGVQGLAGPLHGLAAQEVVRFILQMNESIEGNIKDSSKIEEYLWSLLNSKRVIPGYGHGVLRKPDPRFDAMMQFGFNRPQEFKDDTNFQLVNSLSQIAPSVLKEHGKCKNPFPNVDSSSGILFYHYGLKELLFFTVIFGGARSMGPLSQLVWDRVYGLPIERPKSVTLEMLTKL